MNLHTGPDVKTFEPELESAETWAEEDACSHVAPELDVGKPPARAGHPGSSLGRSGQISGEVSQILDDIRRALKRGPENARPAALRLVKLLESPAAADSAGARGSLAPWQKRKIERYLKEHLERPVRVDELAMQIPLTVSHFTHAFKKTFGDTPHMYIVRLRLERAKELMLRTAEPLSQVALACGFADQSHLCKAFQRGLGESPNAWRRRNLTEAQAEARALWSYPDPYTEKTSARACKNDAQVNGSRGGVGAEIRGKLPHSWKRAGHALGLRSPPPMSTAADSRPRSMAGATPIVFVVDDDISVCESLERLIADAGWRPELFASGQEFLARPRPAGPSCLILDISLSDFDGLELQKRIAGERTAMPIIFITGHGDIPTTVRAMKAGAVEFLTKPFTPEVLLGAMQTALERSRASLDEEASLRALRDRYLSLSRREQEVMALVVRGNLNKQVGGALGISEITVKAHRGRMRSKMGARSLPELVNIAARLGLETAGKG